MTFPEFDRALQKLIHESIVLHDDQPDPLQVPALTLAIKGLIARYVRETLDFGNFQEVLANVVANSSGGLDLEKVDTAATLIEERMLSAFVDAAQKMGPK